MLITIYIIYLLVKCSKPVLYIPAWHYSKLWSDVMFPLHEWKRYKNVDIRYKAIINNNNSCSKGYRSPTNRIFHYKSPTVGTLCKYLQDAMLGWCLNFTMSNNLDNVWYSHTWLLILGFCYWSLFTKSPSGENKSKKRLGCDYNIYQVPRSL